MIKKLINRLSTSMFIVLSSSPVFAQIDPENPVKEGSESVIAEGSVLDRVLFGDGGLFEQLVNTLLFLVGAISVVMLIFGGIRYVTSAGDQQRVTDAKNTILYAVIGLVVAFLAYAAVQFVVSSLAT